VNIHFETSETIRRTTRFNVPEDWNLQQYRFGMYVGSLFLVVLKAVKVKVKFSSYRPGVAQRVGRGIALLFHDRGTRC